jgi:hypothetical protein
MTNRERMLDLNR